MPKIGEVVKKTVGPNRFKLAERIIALSEADVWDEARFEWELYYIFSDPVFIECLCGHYPIKERCVIENKHNGNQTIVGNVCVNKFLGIRSDKIFRAFDRITLDEEAALNAEAIEFAYVKGWINDWEKKFYLDTRRKRNLSYKQTLQRIRINNQVLSFYERGYENA